VAVVPNADVGGWAVRRRPRLTNAQLNRCVLAILKGEPLFYLAALVSL
jgi:hypothetical protein